jgi:uncharacterized protein (UPF0248 family)
MIKIGDLVKWEPDCTLSWLAIILNDREEEDDYGDFVMLIQWVTGTYIGQEDYIPVEELEVIA